MHPLHLLGDVGHVESHFNPFGDSGSVSAHGLRQTYHKLINHFGCTRWYSKVMRRKSKLDLVCLEIVLIWTQDRSMVCAERSIGLEIILDTRDGTPR